MEFSGPSDPLTGDPIKGSTLGSLIDSEPDSYPSPLPGRTLSIYGATGKGVARVSADAAVAVTARYNMLECVIELAENVLVGLVRKPFCNMPSEKYILLSIGGDTICSYVAYFAP
jgi:hypothetical protein